MQNNTNIPIAKLTNGMPFIVGFKNKDNYDVDDDSGERTRTYGVVTEYNTTEYTQKIQYNITISYINKNLSSKNWLVTLSKSQVYINNASLDNVVDSLAENFSKQVLYPVVLEVSPQGEVLGIDNYNEIIERYKKFKIRTNKEYKGLLITRYLELISQNMESEYTLQSVMEKEWFWALFFKPIYNTFSFRKKQKLNILLPSFSSYNPCTYYKGELLTQQEHIREGIIAMSFNGISKAITYKEEQDLEANTIIDYELSATTHLIKEIRSKAVLTKDKINHKTITTTIIHRAEKDIIKKKPKKRFFF